ncbi:MAG TPA: hypothetical protein VFE07_01570, partial [Marmoricola sp.]|nr:hypothetical protein [Marmoricola sp.]
ALLLLAALLAVAVPAQADDEVATLSEQPVTPDPYTVDDPTGSTDPDDPAQVPVRFTITGTQDGTTVELPDDTGSCTLGGTCTPLIPRTGSLGATWASGCREISGKITGYNVLGDKIWSFRMTAYWCWSGGRITYKHSDYDVSTPGQWWRCLDNSDCLVGTSSSSGSTSPWIRYREAGFGQCFPSALGGGCYHKNYPWLRFYMYGNGSYTIKHGVG